MQPPRPQRQRLQFHRRGSDKGPECHGSDDDAQHIGDVVPIDGNVARAASLDAAVLLRFHDAREGGGDGVGGSFRRGGRRGAGGDSEGVDEFEDEEAGEGAAEVGDAIGKWGSVRVFERTRTKREVGSGLTWRGESCRCHR